MKCVLLLIAILLAPVCVLGHSQERFARALGALSPSECEKLLGFRDDGQISRQLLKTLTRSDSASDRLRVWLLVEDKALASLVGPTGVSRYLQQISDDPGALELKRIRVDAVLTWIQIDLSRSDLMSLFDRFSKDTRRVLRWAGLARQLRFELREKASAEQRVQLSPSFLAKMHASRLDEYFTASLSTESLDVLAKLRKYGFKLLDESSAQAGLYNARVVASKAEMESMLVSVEGRVSVDYRQKDQIQLSKGYDYILIFESSSRAGQARRRLAEVGLVEGNPQHVSSSQDLARASKPDLLMDRIVAVLGTASAVDKAKRRFLNIMKVRSREDVDADMYLKAFEAFKDF